MKSQKIEMRLRHRANHLESMEDRHADVQSRIGEVGPPLGFAGVEQRETPAFNGNYLAWYGGRYPNPGLRFEGYYEYRRIELSLEDTKHSDDVLYFWFKNTNEEIDYKEALRTHAPEVAVAYRSYRLDIRYANYAYEYTGGALDTNEIYNRLRADKSIDVNGRNNTFTLGPACFWDGELCRRALGYDRDEAIRRLEGRVPLVMPLLDGVYVVFNDNPNLSYPDFLAINETFKPVLGLE